MQNQDKPTDQATKATELSEADLEQVAGGGKTNDVTVNKAKTADKAYQAMDGYIKS